MKRNFRKLGSGLRWFEGKSQVTCKGWRRSETARGWRGAGQLGASSFTPAWWWGSLYQASKIDSKNQHPSFPDATALLPAPSTLLFLCIFMAGCRAEAAWLVGGSGWERERRVSITCRKQGFYCRAADRIQEAQLNLR